MSSSLSGSGKIGPLDNKTTENQQNVHPSSQLIPGHKSIIEELYPHNIPAISYHTKSPKKRSSSENIQHDYRCFSQSDVIGTSIDFNAKVQLQHRKESFSSSLENEDTFSRTNLHAKPTWSNSKIGKASSQSAFTKVISPQRVPALHPHAVSSYGKHHAARNLSMFSSSHSVQRKPTSTKTSKDFATYKQSSCSSIPPRDFVFESLTSHKRSTDQSSPKSQPKASSTSSTISLTCNVPTYNKVSQTLLSDIPEEESLNQTQALASSYHQITVSTTGQNPPTSQTVLFTIPPNFNVQQLSNQPLNLDMNSQHLLQSIVQFSNQPEKDTTSDKEDKEANPTNNSILDDSHRLIIDLPEDKTPNTTLGSIPTELKLPSENKSDEEPSKLPTAAINYDVIDGQQMYFIELNGYKIPIAAIAIPTADGTSYLRSGLTSLPSSSETPRKSDSPLPVLNDPVEITPTLSTINQADYITSTPTSTRVASAVKSDTKRFVCEICGKAYVRAGSYYTHLREHGNDLPKEHKCMICVKSFDTVEEIKQHLASHKNEKPKKPSELCTICNKTFNGASALRIHQLSHVTDKSYDCKADGCSKVFPNSGALRIHQRVHQEEKPYKCNHTGCGKAFKTPSELTRHEFRHTGEKPYKCDKCDKSFVRNDDLRRHSFIHTGQKRFKCDECDFSCIQSFDLVKHKYIHGGEKPYKCMMCPKQFTRPARLREHERLHTGERPYTCEECGKSFSQLSSLKSHKMTHESNLNDNSSMFCIECNQLFLTAAQYRVHKDMHERIKLTCLICNKVFVSAKTLKRHAIVHTGEKPFECEVCLKRFARAGDLKVHIPVHFEEKPHKCEHCSKSFSRFTSLREHVRLHTGLYPYKCHVCDKIFNHQSHLKTHLRMHTGEKPHKCPICAKEFSRKTSLKHHMRTHGITDANLQDWASTSTQRQQDGGMVAGGMVDNLHDEDSNFSDGSFLEGPQALAVDPEIWKSIHNINAITQKQGGGSKRKRTLSDDGEELDGLLAKRLLTDPHLSNYQQVKVAGSINHQPFSRYPISSSETQTLLQPLQTGQIQQSQQYLASDGNVVSFNFAEGNDNEGLVEIHGLENLHSIETQPLITHQSEPITQHLHQPDIHALNIAPLSIPNTSLQENPGINQGIVGRNLPHIHQ